MPDRFFQDQIGRSLRLPALLPRRIVSLVPSQTALLHALGLTEEVVGITKFCTHPADWQQTKTRVGGTKTLHLPRIAALQPDLILANREENERDQVEALATRWPVWVSDVRSPADALAMLHAVGELTGRTAAAEALATQIVLNFERHATPPQWVPPRTAYLIWRKPYMVAGGDTFVQAMLAAAGFENVFGGLARYPEVSAEQLAEAAPECLLLSSEPYPFAEKHRSELQAICPAARVLLVDGELFSWYGSHLLAAPAYFARLRAVVEGQ